MDRGALEELIKRHERELYGFVSRFIRGAADPDDVYQEIVLKVLVNLHRYNPNLSFRTWLFTLAANLCKNVLRTKERGDRRRSPAIVRRRDDSTKDIIEMAQNGAPRPDDRLEGDEFVAALDRELAELPALQREVFILREYNGMTFKDIARIVGVPEPTARSRMFLALDYLRTRLREHREGGGERGVRRAGETGAVKGSE